MIRNKILTACIVVSACVTMMGLGACSTPMATTGEGSDEGGAVEQVEYTDDSLIAKHMAFNQDLTALVEKPSPTSCTQDTMCHGGSWDKVVEDTENYYNGENFSVVANPHAAHATNGFECEDCHSLTGTSVARCNSCHEFKVPDGWIVPDFVTSLWLDDEPPYTGDGVQPRAE